MRHSGRGPHSPRGAHSLDCPLSPWSPLAPWCPLSPAVPSRVRGPHCARRGLVAALARRGSVVRALAAAIARSGAPAGLWWLSANPWPWTGWREFSRISESPSIWAATGRLPQTTARPPDQIVGRGADAPTRQAARPGSGGAAIRGGSDQPQPSPLDRVRRPGRRIVRGVDTEASPAAPPDLERPAASSPPPAHQERIATPREVPGRHRSRSYRDGRRRLNRSSRRASEGPGRVSRDGIERSHYCAAGSAPVPGLALGARLLRATIPGVEDRPLASPVATGNAVGIRSSRPPARHRHRHRHRRRDRASRPGPGTATGHRHRDQSRQRRPRHRRPLPAPPAVASRSSSLTRSPSPWCPRPAASGTGVAIPVPGWSGGRRPLARPLLRRAARATAWPVGAPPAGGRARSLVPEPTRGRETARRNERRRGCPAPRPRFAEPSTEKPPLGVRGAPPPGVARGTVRHAGVRARASGGPSPHPPPARAWRPGRRPRRDRGVEAGSRARDGPNPRYHRPGADRSAPPKAGRPSAGRGLRIPGR